MGKVDTDWFEPAKLFDGGYPSGLTSALRALPQLHKIIVDEIGALGARKGLEVGPGDIPLIGRVPRRMYLDVADAFLTPMKGLAIKGSLLQAPFVDGAFDVVVASDVLTHIRPPERPQALDELARIGRMVVLFNPEPGTPDVVDSAVPTEPIVKWFEERGHQTRVRSFRVSAPAEYTMALIMARK
jgi:hypothetical protein